MQLLSLRPCVMFSTTTCPFCEKTKKVLSGMGVMYTIIDFDEDEEGPALRAELAEVIGRTSVPAVFAGGEFLGGCNDGGLGGVVTLHEKGELAPLLIKAGALSPTQRI
jgi:glutaredoxin